jgi:hypothetical protein
LQPCLDSVANWARASGYDYRFVDDQIFDLLEPGLVEKLQGQLKVHNAFLMFRPGNHFLDFYTDTAERLLHLNQGRMPPQFIGPKLLTALHNIAFCPVMETAGMLSPAVMHDLLAGAGEALDLFHRKSPAALAGANLSSSLTEREGLSEAHMESLIQLLLSSGSVVTAFDER